MEVEKLVDGLVENNFIGKVLKTIYALIIVLKSNYI